MRWHWIILAGVVGGGISTVPYWEVFDPSQALPHRRFIYLALFASHTLGPFLIGFVAGRDFGGRVATRVAAGCAAGLVSALVLFAALCVIPTWVRTEWSGLAPIAGWLITFSGAGGGMSFLYRTVKNAS